MDLAALLDRGFRARPGPTPGAVDKTPERGTNCQKICPGCLTDGRVVDEDRDNGAKCGVLGFMVRLVLTAKREFPRQCEEVTASAGFISSVRQCQSSK